MTTRIQRNKHYPIIFTALFLFSTALYFTVTIIRMGGPGEQPSYLPERSAQIIELLSLLTSGLSLLALLSGTVLSWLREKREKERTRLNQRLLRIQLRREEIALEQEEAELRRLRTVSKKNNAAGVQQ